MNRYPISDVRRLGAATAAKQAVARVHTGKKQLILHFDADVVSSTHFSATNYGTPDGLTAEETGAALEVFCARDELAAFVVTEYIADKDADGSGARKLIDLIVAALRTRVAAPASEESPAVEKAEPDAAPAEAASNS